MNKLQASLLTLSGGLSYGLLSGFAKLAYKNGVQPGVLATLQNLLGAIFLWGLALVLEGRPWKRDLEAAMNPEAKDQSDADQPDAGPSGSELFRSGVKWSHIKSLLVVGSLSGLTSTLYYLTLNILPAALGIILLFQFTWLGVLLEVIFEGRRPDKYSMLALLLLIPGTILAVGTGWGVDSIPWAGIGLGLLSAVT
ncbi:MAG TPA: hypothetical protein VHS59_06185, partial [Bacillota bacterium]|nr:hypothetical protein [Bacillota bacterium]